MAKSNFSALVEAKRSRDSQVVQTDDENISQKIESAETKTVVTEPEIKSKTERQNDELSEKNEAVDNRKEILETVRRSYKIEVSHDKAIKVMSKFMGQGTEEEIVMKIFRHYFENNADGNKAIEMVGMLNRS